MNSMQEHTVKAFDEDITRLRGLIDEMGGLSEAAIAQSLEALVNGADELADRVVKADAPPFDQIKDLVDNPQVVVLEVVKDTFFPEYVNPKLIPNPLLNA